MLACYQPPWRVTTTSVRVRLARLLLATRAHPPSHPHRSRCCPSSPDFEDDGGSRDGSYVGFDDAYDMDQGDARESQAPAKSMKKNPFNRDRRNSSEQRGKDGVHAF